MICEMEDYAGLSGWALDTIACSCKREAESAVQMDQREL